MASLTNLLPAGLQDFFQVLSVSSVTTTVNKVLECSTDPLGLSLGYSVANFLLPQILSHEDAKTQHFVVNCRTILFKSKVITIQLLNIW